MSQVKNRDPVWLRRGVACLAAVLSVTFPLCLAGATVAKPQHHDVIRSASKNPGSVNTLLIRAPHGLVIIDGGRNRAGGRRAVGQSRGTGERVAAILITHAHRTMSVAWVSCTAPSRTRRSTRPGRRRRSCAPTRWASIRSRGATILTFRGD